MTSLVAPSDPLRGPPLDPPLQLASPLVHTHSSSLINADSSPSHTSSTYSPEMTTSTLEDSFHPLTRVPRRPSPNEWRAGKEQHRSRLDVGVASVEGTKQKEGKEDSIDLSSNIVIHSETDASPSERSSCHSDINPTGTERDEDHVWDIRKKDNSFDSNGEKEDHTRHGPPRQGTPLPRSQPFTPNLTIPTTTTTTTTTTTAHSHPSPSSSDPHYPSSSHPHYSPSSCSNSHAQPHLTTQPSPHLRPLILQPQPHPRIRMNHQSNHQPPPPHPNRQHLPRSRQRSTESTLNSTRNERDDDHVQRLTSRCVTPVDKEGVRCEGDDTGCGFDGRGGIEIHGDVSGRGKGSGSGSDGTGSGSGSSERSYLSALSELDIDPFNRNQGGNGYESRMVSGGRKNIQDEEGDERCREEDKQNGRGLKALILTATRVDLTNKTYNSHNDTKTTTKPTVKSNSVASTNIDTNLDPCKDHLKQHHHHHPSRSTAYLSQHLIPRHPRSAQPFATRVTKTDEDRLKRLGLPIEIGGAREGRVATMGGAGRSGNLNRGNGGRSMEPGSVLGWTDTTATWSTVTQDSNQDRREKWVNQGKGGDCSSSQRSSSDPSASTNIASAPNRCRSISNQQSNQSRSCHGFGQRVAGQKVSVPAAAIFGADLGQKAYDHVRGNASAWNPPQRHLAPTLSQASTPSQSAARSHQSYHNHNHKYKHGQRQAQAQYDRSSGYGWQSQGHKKVGEAMLREMRQEGVEEILDKEVGQGLIAYLAQSILTIIPPACPSSHRIDRKDCLAQSRRIPPTPETPARRIPVSAMNSVESQLGMGEFGQVGMMKSLEKEGPDPERHLHMESRTSAEDNSSALLSATESPPSEGWKMPKRRRRRPSPVDEHRANTPTPLIEKQIILPKSFGTDVFDAIAPDPTLAIRESSEACIFVDSFGGPRTGLELDQDATCPIHPDICEICHTRVGRWVWELTKTMQLVQYDQASLLGVAVLLQRLQVDGMDISHLNDDYLLPNRSNYEIIFPILLRLSEISLKDRNHARNRAIALRGFLEAGSLREHVWTAMADRGELGEGTNDWDNENSANEEMASLWRASYVKVLKLLNWNAALKGRDLRRVQREVQMLFS